MAKPQIFFPGDLSFDPDPLVSGDEAWVEQTTLEAAGLSADHLTRLQAEGWVEPWPLPQGVCWCLTPWAAERFNVHLVERWQRQDGPGDRWLEVPCWSSQEPTGPIFSRPPGCREVEFSNFSGWDSIEMPRVGPELLEDPFRGGPLKLLGRYVQVDPRLRPKRRARPSRGKRAKSARTSR
jgi:hypothetical protein